MKNFNTQAFTVKSLIEGEKENSVSVTIVFNNDPKQREYTYKNRKEYTEKKKGTRYVLVNGIKVNYMRTISGLEFVSLEQGYEVGSKGIIKTNSGLKEKAEKKIEAEKIGAQIKAEIEKDKIEIPEIVKNYDSEIHHKEFDTIVTCIENNIPVYLAGPAGSGKNHTLEQAAKMLGLDFYFTNSVQQEYKLTGFIDAGGSYHETEFYKAFTKGGLFFLDEMDASIPEVLVLLNAAIANGYFEFPNGKVNAHKDFRVVAAGNTVGSGADEQYTGRMVLDQATLDRFVIINFDYDREIEMHIAKGDIQLVDFIEKLREIAEVNQIRATFSYRCITMMVKLSKTLEIEKVIAIAVVKGMDKDTINILAGQINLDNKYAKALKRVAA